jgi:hypothetical protein
VTKKTEQVLYMWKSNQQKTISKLLNEAELYACADAAKVIKFTYQVLTTMGIKTKLPIVL